MERKDNNVFEYTLRDTSNLQPGTYTGNINAESKEGTKNNKPLNFNLRESAK